MNDIFYLLGIAQFLFFVGFLCFVYGLIIFLIISIIYVAVAVLPWVCIDGSAALPIGLCAVGCDSCNVFGELFSSTCIQFSTVFVLAADSIVLIISVGDSVV